MSGVQSWGQLLAVNCAELEGAADGWGAASNRADAARDRIEKHLLVGLETTQRGEAATAAVARLRALSRNFQYIYTECGLIRTTLNSFAHDLRAAQRKLREALDQAAALRYTVAADGSVTYPAGGESMVTRDALPGGRADGQVNRLLSPPDLRNPNPNHAKAQDIADRIIRAVCEARDVDVECTGALRRLMALDDGLKVTDAMWTDAHGDADTVRSLADHYLRSLVPEDRPPAERKAWWEGLTQEQREEYLAVYPDVIGNLDGIPATVRDTANRDNLQLLIGKLDGRDDEISQTRLAALRAIDRELRAGGHPPMYLLGIGDEGNGRAIVSYGNPDASKNVSAYVPGLNTALDKQFVENDLKRARDTAVGAREYDRSSASIAWLGYDAPQLSAGGMADNADVMFTHRASSGATAYNEFMSGISAANRNEDPHVTAIGHFYGSLTVGQAAQREGGVPGVDDIVLLGSPGTGADSAEELGVGSKHVFVGAADNDVVTKMPAKEQVMLGVQGLVEAGTLGAEIFGEPSDDDRWFGRDPASEAFRGSSLQGQRRATALRRR